ncbi:hypothetical protein CHS0354_016289 [Potamilus streckersoni]|uniref:Uncharacterized protein n=1 Tax=Potamilus streckersoni TaxID=2493646 RepID=A0AAE0RXD7_9BIVA|nr:hypothetical protein CHS0354_016289 [Potamilus streckersoni]
MSAQRCSLCLRNIDIAAATDEIYESHSNKVCNINLLRTDHREKNTPFSSTVVNRNKHVTISGGKGNIINIGGYNSNSMKIVEGGSQSEVSKSTKARRRQPSDTASNVFETEIHEIDAVQEQNELRPGDILEGEEISLDVGSSAGQVDSTVKPLFLVSISHLLQYFLHSTAISTEQDLTMHNAPED